MITEVKLSMAAPKGILAAVVGWGSSSLLGGDGLHVMGLV